MSYPVKYRERTIEYRQEGHTLKETSKVFKVTITTIREWEKRLKEKGTLAPDTPRRSFKKIDPEKLKAYLAEHPDAYQREMAKEFGCVESAIRRVLKKLGITRKKDEALQGAGLRPGSCIQIRNIGY